MEKKSQHGFTLVELLVIIAIIGLLSTVISVGLRNSRSQSRDARRLSDISMIQAELASYAAYNDKYPISVTPSPTIPAVDPPINIPAAPLPPDGNCKPEENTYMYQSIDGTSYGLTFCVGSAIGGNPSGYLFAGLNILSLRYDMTRDGVLSSTSDPARIIGCVINVLDQNSALCQPLEFLDINKLGDLSSNDASTLFNILTALGY